MYYKDSVAAYHNKIKRLVFHFPAPDAERGIPDYEKIIRKRAKELGFVNEKGANKGEGNVSAYIMSLIAKDTGIEIVGLSAIDNTQNI